MDSKKTTEITIPLPEDASGDLVVHFKASRNTLIRAELAGVHVEGPPIEIEDHSLLVRGVERLAGASLLRLRIEHEFERPIVVGTESLAKGASVPKTPSPWELHQERRGLARDLDPRIRVGYEFFVDFEEETNWSILRHRPDVDPEDEYKYLHTDLTGQGRRVLVERALNAARGKPDPGDHSLNTLMKEHVARLLPLLERLIKVGFGNGGWPNARGMQAMGVAFEQFASGSLRVSDRLHLNAEPDSGQFFLFAEVALVTLSLPLTDPQEGFWLEAARIFVRSERLFVEAYRPCKAWPEIDDYGPESFGGGRVSDDFVARLRAAFEDADREHLERAHSACSLLAFPGEIRREA